ncbi:MAG: CCA tRNA nucleotidyltransferase, partial [Oscillospiraceae bacterium]
MLNLPTAAISVIEILQQNGFEAFAVGGCVRDALMGKACHDIDITTDALPEQVACAFGNYPVIPTGIKHGTVTVMIKNEPVEITTYRTEGEYTDLRRPDKVSFVGDIRMDLARRDFTINAICYNPQMGVCDYQQGCEDVKNKVIRCVGQARKRFSEDPLRILRGLRFSSVLEFSIENATEKAMFEMAPLLKNVSGERLLCEMSKLLCGKGIKEVLLKYSDILSVIIPEIKAMKNFKQNNPHHIYDVLTHTAVALENTPPEEILRFAVLFHDIGKPFCYTQDEKGVGHFYRHPKLSEKISETVMNRLKADNNMKKVVCFLVLNHDVNIPPTEKSVK